MKTTYLNSVQLAEALGRTKQRIHQMIKEGKFSPTISSPPYFLFSLKAVQNILAKYPKKEKLTQ